MDLADRWLRKSLEAQGAYRRRLGQEVARDRAIRRQEARRFLYALCPDVGYARLNNLIDMAVTYWERPGRYA